MSDQEKILIFHQIEVDIPEETLKLLKQKGFEWIQEDEKELVNYAVNRLLKDMIAEKENELN